MALQECGFHKCFCSFSPLSTPLSNCRIPNLFLQSTVLSENLVVLFFFPPPGRQDMTEQGQMLFLYVEYTSRFALCWGSFPWSIETRPVAWHVEECATEAVFSGGSLLSSLSRVKVAQYVDTAFKNKPRYSWEYRVLLFLHFNHV